MTEKIFGALGFVPGDLDEIRPGKPVERLAFTATNAYRITIELLSSAETKAVIEHYGQLEKVRTQVRKNTKK